MHWAPSQLLLLGWGYCAWLCPEPGGSPVLLLGPSKNWCSALCLLPPLAPRSLKISVLGFEVKNCFLSVLESECCPPSTQWGLRHWPQRLWGFAPNTEGAAGSSFRTWVCVRTGKPKSPINRPHWLSAFSVHCFPFWTGFWPYYAHWKNRCKFPGGC